MSRVERSPDIIGAGDDPKREPSREPDAPVLDPELVRRFHALIDEVADALMQAAGVDRRTARTDAVTLLVATCEAMEEGREPGESPLAYLLQEERQKAAAALGRQCADTVPDPVMLRA